MWTARLLLLALAALALDISGAHAQTTETRESLIARAQIWTATSVASMDMRRGPLTSPAIAPGQTLRCKFVNRSLTGNSPKFACVLPSGEELKVKYGATNGEVRAEVAATRLLWALGFGADIMQPVRVLCEGCPEFVAGQQIGPDKRLVDPAAVELKMPGSEIPFTSEAWAWPELDLISVEAGGAPSEQRDALKLLAVFLQHTDSKPEQQRLFCLDQAANGTTRCRHPFMMLNDVGLTFGRANLANNNPLGSANLREWSQVPIWRDDSICVGNLPRSLTGTLKDPVISEEGREFLANLMTQLTDSQLRALFDVARMEPDSWVPVFKAKREEILDRRCDVLWPGGITALFGTGPILWLQRHASPPLTVIMNGVSLLGYTRVYLAVAVGIAFLVNLRAGTALLLLLALNGVLSDAAKVIVSSPRPAAVDAGVQVLSIVETLAGSFAGGSPPSIDTADGYGFPSGHVSATTAFLFGLAYLFRWSWAAKAMVIWIPLMAFSRLYLGRHFVGDVLGGVGLGVITVAIGFLALTLARLSTPGRARGAAGRALVTAVAVAVCVFAAGIPAEYDAGRFLGLAAGATWVVLYVESRSRLDSFIGLGTRIGSLGIAMAVFALSWWGTHWLVSAMEIRDTPTGALMSGTLPMLFLLPLPLYMIDRIRARHVRLVQA